MTATNETYKAYESMLHKFVNDHADLYNVDKEELMGEALIIFCKASESFDSEKKIAFSTHLWHQLRDLSSKAFKEQNILNRWYSGMPSDPYSDNSPASSQFNQGIFEHAIATIDFSNTKSDLMFDIAMQLSEDSQQYLTDLFSGVFQDVKNFKGGRPSKFPVPKICNHYGWSKKQALSVKEEITEWWAAYRKSA